MATSPAATTMPGGAPLTRASKRPCKYGPRDVDGLCPKKPTASSRASKTASGSSSKKPPCKYGPRTADGKCPKKPKQAKSDRAPTVRNVKSVSAAGQQAGEVLRSKKATSEQKREAVKVLGVAVATESTKKVGEHVAREARKVAGTPAAKAAAKSALKKAAAVAGVVPTIAGIGATLYLGGKALTANRKRECKAWAAAQLKLTQSKLKQTLTPDQRATLLAQYEAHCNKKPVTNSYSGK